MDDEDAAAVTFGTDGWRATLDAFTEPRVRMVAQAVATYLDDEGIEGALAVGYDARPTSRNFAEQLARVVAGNGRDVTLAETDCPTPVVAWTIRERDLAGGLMVTASHNPPEYNGVKFLPADGAPALPPVTDAIVDRLADPSPTDGEYGTITEDDLVGPYLGHARRFVDADLNGLRVAYDAMHGSGRGVTDQLLERAGAKVGRLRCEQDDEFGGTPPEPTAERVPELIERVTEGEADLGIVNDGDADRIGVVTPERGFLDPNQFLAATYEYLLEDEVGDVVRTVSTSSLVDRVAEANGQETHETAVGFKWVAEAMKEHDALFGGEESAGFAVRGHIRNKDGVLLALLAAAATKQEAYDDRIDALTDRFGEIHQDRVSVDCPDDRKAAVLSDLEDVLPAEVAGSPVAEVNTVDGFKIALEDGGWLLVRPSGTEPKMRIYAEGGSADRVDELLDEGHSLVEPLV
ncbi:phosphoglucomutase/phosphomannomutase family protein [Halobacteriales archaeon Cl-PHB]